MTTLLSNKNQPACATVVVKECNFQEIKINFKFSLQQGKAHNLDFSFNKKLVKKGESNSVLDGSRIYMFL